MINEKDLPDGWRLLNLRDVCINKGEYGSGASAIEYDENKPRYIRITDIDENGLLKKTRNVSPSIVEVKYFLNEGDLLFARSGSVGKTYLYNKKDGFCQYAGYLIRFKPDLSLIDSNYLFFLTKTPYYWNWIDSKKKILTIPNINAKQYSELKIPLPPLPTQKKIVAILEKAEKLKGWRREADELTDKLLKSTFLEMFGDPVKNPMGWEKKKLKEFGEVKTGNTPSRKNPEYYGDYIEWIKSDNINTPHTYLTKSEEMLSEEGAKIGRIAPKGSVLVTCIAGSLSCIGNIGIADRDVGFIQQINAIIPNKEVNKLFLYHLILITKNYIQNYSTKSMKGMLSKSIFESIFYIFPPTPLQNKFGKFASKIEILKQNQTESKEQIDFLFNSLMQQAFKGEHKC